MSLKWNGLTLNRRFQPQLSQLKKKLLKRVKSATPLDALQSDSTTRQRTRFLFNIMLHCHCLAVDVCTQCNLCEFKRTWLKTERKTISSDAQAINCKYSEYSLRFFPRLFNGRITNRLTLLVETCVYVYVYMMLFCQSAWYSLKYWVSHLLFLTFVTSYPALCKCVFVFFFIPSMSFS